MSVVNIWSIGVGSVIGGDFFGWSSLLGAGIGAALVSFGLTMTLYFILARSVASLASIVKTHGGADVFVLEGLGSTLQHLTASLETVKLTFVVCSVGIGIVDYIVVLANTDNKTVQYILFAVLYTVFGFINALGATFSSTVQLLITLFCLLTLSFYWIAITTQFDFQTYALDSNSLGEASSWFYGGFEAFALAFPFAAWLFLGFEELPLLCVHEEEVQSGGPVDEIESQMVFKDTVIEETSRKKKKATTSSASSTSTTISPPPSSTPTVSVGRQNNNKGIILSYLTVALAGSFTLVLGASSSPGCRSLVNDQSPLISGIAAVFGSSSWVSKTVNVLVVAALVSPFNAFILYSGHHLQHLSMHGTLPTWFAQRTIWPTSSSSSSSSTTTPDEISSEKRLSVDSQVIPIEVGTSTLDQPLLTFPPNDSQQRQQQVHSQPSNSNIASSATITTTTTSTSTSTATASPSHVTPVNALLVVCVVGVSFLCLVNGLFGLGE